MVRWHKTYRYAEDLLVCCHAGDDNVSVDGAADEDEGDDRPDILCGPEDRDSQWSAGSFQREISVRDRRGLGLFLWIHLCLRLVARWSTYFNSELLCRP